MSVMAKYQILFHLKLHELTSVSIFYALLGKRGSEAWMSIFSVPCRWIGCILAHHI